jgi:hypothetical protein
MRKVWTQWGNSVAALAATGGLAAVRLEDSPPACLAMTKCRAVTSMYREKLRTL